MLKWEWASLRLSAGNGSREWVVMKVPRLAGVFLLLGFLLTYLTFVKHQRDAAKLHAQRLPQDRLAAWTLPQRPPSEAAAHQYCIVFDAGSTGTRIHIFQFRMDDRGRAFTMVTESQPIGPRGRVWALMAWSIWLHWSAVSWLTGRLLFLQEFRLCTRKRSDPSSRDCRPTLTAHGRWVWLQKPVCWPTCRSHAFSRQCPAGISQLLEVAQSTVPTSMWSSTPVLLRATAGLRLLPERKAQDLLDTVSLPCCWALSHCHHEASVLLVPPPPVSHSSSRSLRVSLTSA